MTDLILHADPRGVNHAVAPVSLQDPLLLARQVGQLLVAALYVFIQRRQVAAPLQGAFLQNTQDACKRYSTRHVYTHIAYSPLKLIELLFKPYKTQFAVRP